MHLIYKNGKLVNTVIYAPTYRSGSTKYFVVHNSGSIGSNPLSKSQHLTAENINNAHKDRWNFESSFIKGSFGGYNFICEEDGTVYQYRAIGEETAHAKGYNFNGLAISYCIMGNFTDGVETPTMAQKLALRRLYEKMVDMGIKVSKWNIVPHRTLQNTTSCFGSGLADSWARDIIFEKTEDEDKEKIAKLEKLIALLIKLIELRRKALGAFLLPLAGKKTPCNQADLRG